MKKRSCWPILFAAWPYVVLGAEFLWLYVDGIIAGIVSIGAFVSTVVIYVANIVNACTYKNVYDDYDLAFWNMLVKLIHIPVHLVMFVTGVLFLLAAVVPGLIFITPIVTLLLAAVSYVLIIGTSTYGINALIRAKKKGRISTGFVIVNIILHVFFVTDVIGAIVVFVKMNKNRRVMYQGMRW